jgi:hypothetical protein
MIRQLRITAALAAFASLISINALAQPPAGQPGGRGGRGGGRGGPAYVSPEVGADGSVTVRQADGRGDASRPRTPVFSKTRRSPTNNSSCSG